MSPYEQFLYAAKQHELAGRIDQAIACLDRAKRQTRDEDEPAHLALWRRRLEQEA